MNCLINNDEKRFEEGNEKKECLICYDVVSNNNIAITPCFHTFCFNCIVKSLSHNRNCPLCRNDLMGDEVYNNFYQNEEESEYDTETDTTEDYGSDSEMNSLFDALENEEITDDEENFEPDVREYQERLLSKGYTMLDIMTLLMGERSKLQTKEHYKKLKKDYEEVYVEINNEYDENYLFGKEDINAIYLKLHTPLQIKT